MKRISVLLLAALLVLAGCQPTPETDAVLNPLVMINAIDGTVIDPYAGY